MLRSGLLLFALVFCLVGAAQAKEYQFTFVTMDIPDSCHFMPREGAIFVQDDNNHFFTLDIKPVDAATDPAAYAATLAGQSERRRCTRCRRGLEFQRHGAFRSLCRYRPGRRRPYDYHVYGYAARPVA